MVWRDCLGSAKAYKFKANMFAAVKSTGLLCILLWNYCNLYIQVLHDLYKVNIRALTCPRLLGCEGGRHVW